MGARPGPKCITLRSLAVLNNSTDAELDVCLCPRDLLGSDDSTTVESREVEMYENQRYQALLGWGSTGYLLPSDPPRYTDQDLANASQELNIDPLPGWEFTDNWRVDHGMGDRDGWFYGQDFKSLVGQVSPVYTKSKKGPFDFVRRRRIIRQMERKAGGRVALGSSKGPIRRSLGLILPGGSMALPWTSLVPGSDWCLQLRPHMRSVAEGASTYKWSRVVRPPSDQSAPGSFLLPDDDRAKQQRRTTGTAFVMAELSVAKEASKREELLECVSPSDSWWLCLEAEPSRLQADGGAPVMDWRLVVRAPLKLENRLPAMAEFIVWEKPTKAPTGVRPVSRKHGLVKAGDGVHVYSVDIRAQVLLTWLPQGGWKHDKDAVLISDPWVSDLPGHFWMVNAQSQRKLRVSVENDMGGSEVAAKIVRLFVPYWLRNDALVSLSCRLVEIEPPASTQQDINWLEQAAKAAQNAKEMPTHVARNTGQSTAMASKVIRSLEAIEDAQDSQPIMLSLPSVSNVGLAVALNPSGVFSSAIALKAFENKMERVELKAVDPQGCYMKLSVSLDLTSLGYERTKVVRLQPHTLFTNSLGEFLYVRQTGCKEAEALKPTDVLRPLLWESIWQPELMQVRIAGCEWSCPFALDEEKVNHIVMRSESDGSRVMIRAEVTNGVKLSRFLVMFRRAGHQPPYKIENRCSILPVRFRQLFTSDNSWELLSPGSTLPFAWEDLMGDRRFEVKVDGAEPGQTRILNIDHEADILPTSWNTNLPCPALRFTVRRELAGPMTVQITDWRPSSGDDEGSVTSGLMSTSSSSSNLTSLGPGGASAGQDEAQGNQKKFYVNFLLDEFGLSVIDHTPEELLYISMQGAVFQYDTNVNSGSRIKVRIGHVQVDNQLLLAAMPVILAPQPPREGKIEYVLKLTVASQSKGEEQFYSYIGLQMPCEAWLVNIHEPIIWRLHAMMDTLSKLGGPASEHTPVEDVDAPVHVDPMVHIGLLNIDEGHIKLTLAMSPSQRPRGVLGFWPTLIASLGNTDEMPIRLTQKVRENIHTRKGHIKGAVISAISNDLLSQPFQLLSGLDVLGNASSALGHVSKGVAALSMDNTFIRSRQKQENKATIEGLGDGLREGGEALAKGLFRGFTGILTKPMEGAQQYGVGGFVSGVGKGIVGVAAQPLSGGLDLLSKTADGINATRLKLTAAMSAKTALKRHRLPRAIGGDGILKPYDDYAARGQVILQLAERGALFGSTAFDIKERSKFAASDAYEEHFNLPGRRTLVITNRRCILLQHPGGARLFDTSAGGPAGSAKRADLLKEPCSILWDVTWDELMTLELKSGKDEPAGYPPSRLVLHLRDWSQDSRLFDTKQIARMVQCHPGTTHAQELRDAIQRAYDKYGPDRATVAAQTKKRRAESRPYTGAGAGVASGAALGLLAGPASVVAVPVMATFGLIVGGAGQVMLESGSDDSPTSAKIAAGGSNRMNSSQSFRSSPALMAMGTEGKEQPTVTIRSFKLVWWDKGALWSQKFAVSIWRPVAPPGYVSVGDLAVAGYDSPEKALVYRNDGDGKFADPLGFDLVWRDTDSGAKTPVTIWMPRAPPGYLALGCVAVADYYEPEARGVVSCVRRDCCGPAPLGRIIWQDRKSAALWRCSLWAVLNNAHTFLARRDHSSPDPSQAFTVAAV
eukprot:TRINITY_DN2254_c0_g1_i1.p1 TRINITY_DN2254_c0_g1~~TRINITY_DN2254_c0_g1_i1.p1  ORF type:complete len:1958 (-),score=356.45 TRINITY_DN2254_c0_g1_i1:258-5252(-)